MKSILSLFGKYLLSECREVASSAPPDPSYRAVKLLRREQPVPGSQFGVREQLEDRRLLIRSQSDAARNVELQLAWAPKIRDTGT